MERTIIIKNADGSIDTELNSNCYILIANEEIDKRTLTSNYFDDVNSIEVMAVFAGLSRLLKKLIKDEPSFETLMKLAPIMAGDTPADPGALIEMLESLSVGSREDSSDLKSDEKKPMLHLVH